MKKEDFEGLHDFKNYIINLLQHNKFAGINLIGMTPDGRLLALGVNMPNSLADVKTGFKALYHELESQLVDNPPSHSESDDKHRFVFKDKNEKDKEDFAKGLNDFLNNSPKSYPQISDPESYGPDHITHEDPLKQAEEIIKNSENFK